MKNIRIALWSLLSGLSALWLVATLPFPETLGLLAVRNLLTQYTGVLSIGAMSLAMILATRARWLEPWLNGLDKSYRLHKWLGISALATAAIHWVAAQGPKWMVGLGLMARQQRGAPADEAAGLGAVQSFLASQRGTAEMLGEWAFYGAAALIILALIKRVPYRAFVSTHTLLAVAYLALVLHAVPLLAFDAWSQPLGLVLVFLMTGGVVSALLALTRQIGRRHRVSGRIDAVHSFSEGDVTAVEIVLDDGWPGHDAGQFAFVTFDPKEGKHPFTVASAWEPETRRITVLAKGLGDYTDRLSTTLHVGAPATVEGPYGRFTFEDTKDRQIWIGGGIGITPFLARMKQLARRPGSRSIDLIHCTQQIPPAALAQLEADAAAAGVRLNLLIDDRDGQLDGRRLRELVPDWKSASVWFCGPAGFGQSLCRDLTAHGLAARDFHQELFAMR